MTTIKGKSRKEAAKAGAYLLNKGKNEKVELIEIKETVSQNVKDAMREMEAVAAGSRSEKFLYHASINFEEGENLTSKQDKLKAVDILEKELKLVGHQRVVVEHNKDNREHLHILWNRVDPETMIARHMSNSYAAHERAAREIERTFGLKHVKGVHVLEENEKPADRAPTHNEIAQSKKTGVNLHKWRNEIRQLAEGKSGAELINALDEQGHIVGQGDKVGFIILDPSGTPQRMAQSLGLKVKELQERLGDIKPINRPNEEWARELQKVKHAEQERQREENRAGQERQKEKQAEQERLKAEQEKLKAAETAASMYSKGSMASQQLDALKHVKDRWKLRELQKEKQAEPELKQSAEQEKKADRDRQLQEWEKRRGTGKSQPESKVEDKRARTEQTDRKQRKSAKDVMKEIFETKFTKKGGGEKERDFERERER